MAHHPVSGKSEFQINNSHYTEPKMHSIATISRKNRILGQFVLHLTLGKLIAQLTFAVNFTDLEEKNVRNEYK